MGIIIGLTGPTGAGKSLVSSVAAQQGYQVIDCDLAARRAVERNSEGLLSLIKVFGDEILNSDGTLNRKALAKRAFSAKENTQLLNETLLPHIVKLIESEMVSDKVLLDAPTLFESGIDKKCTVTVAVLADREERKRRILERDCINEQEAELRMGAGKEDDFYRRRADFVIYNNKGTADFKNEFIKFLEALTEVK